MNKSAYCIFIFVFLFSLSSYGEPASPPYSLNYEFSTEKNYQQVYRLILKNADACSKQGVISKPVAEGQLYSDLKAGDIKISILAPFGKYTHIRVGIEFIDGTTNVSISNDYEAWDGLAKAIKRWAINGSDSCK